MWESQVSAVMWPAKAACLVCSRDRIPTEVCLNPKSELWELSELNRLLTTDGEKSTWPKEKNDKSKSFLLVNINESMPIYDKNMGGIKNAGKQGYRRNTTPKRSLQNFQYWQGYHVITLLEFYQSLRSLLLTFT